MVMFRRRGEAGVFNCQNVDESGPVNEVYARNFDVVKEVLCS